MSPPPGLGMDAELREPGVRFFFAGACLRGRGGTPFSSPEELPTRVSRSARRQRYERGGLVPHAFCCAITHGEMVGPVMASDGHCYERAAIVEKGATRRQRRMPHSPARSSSPATTSGKRSNGGASSSPWR